MLAKLIACTKKEPFSPIFVIPADVSNNWAPLHERLQHEQMLKK